jgi:D-alanyl-D-alanine carboxypeptidase/D-alanyl-D-alanine-endopeptidase (penicillin-binding protein 4)
MLHFTAARCRRASLDCAGLRPASSRSALASVAAAALMLAAQAQAAPLAKRLAALVAAAPLDRAHVGLEVVDLRDGRVVYSHNALAGFTPASNTKLFSGAYALATLGPAYRFETRVLAAAEPDARGTLRGDVVLVGGGDPTLSARHYPYASCKVSGDGTTSLRDFATAIAARGVKRIDGDIVGDDTRYPYEPYAPEWTLDDASAEDGDAAVSALMVNDNAPTARDIARQGALDPAWNAAEQLRLALLEAGISVHGTARARHREPGGAYAAATGVELARRTSPPLGEILTAMEKCSINLHAESLLLEAALASGHGLTSRAQALAARTAFLQQLGVPVEELELHDGSGLARANLVAPHAVATLLVAIQHASWGAAFLAALPAGGIDGTLEHRFHGDAHAARIHAKTGTLNHVSALSGYAGPRYAFALFATEYFPADKAAVLRALDTIALEIANGSN